MSCPTAYVNSVPEHVPVTVNNVTVSLSFGDDEVEWVYERFELGDSAGDLGLDFFLSRPAVAAAQVQVYLDSVPQEYGASKAFTVPATLDRVTLSTALESDAVLTVRYLAHKSTEAWVTEVLHVGDSASGAGLVFTLKDTPKSASYLHVIKDGSLLTGTVDYSLSGADVTLVVALAAGEQLVVTYAHE